MELESEQSSATVGKPCGHHSLPSWSSTHMVHIVKIQGPGLTLFKRMNQPLVDSYKRSGLIPSLGQHHERFEQEYGVKVQTANSQWHGIEFPSESAYVAALLKFG